MINGAEKHDNNQYVGFNYWPSIIVPCDTCSADVKMSHGKENDDKVFCSRKCHIKVKTCRKNAMKDYTILRVLREHPESLPSSEIAYYVSNQHQYQVNGAKISRRLRKWVSEGIVEKANRDVRASRDTSKKVCYRLSEKYQDAPLGALVIKHRTPRGYADAQNTNQ